MPSAFSAVLQPRRAKRRRPQSCAWSKYSTVMGPGEHDSVDTAALFTAIEPADVDQFDICASRGEIY